MCLESASTTGALSSVPPRPQSPACDSPDPHVTSTRTLLTATRYNDARDLSAVATGAHTIHTCVGA